MPTLFAVYNLIDKVTIKRVAIASIISFVLCAASIAPGQRGTFISAYRVSIKNTNTENTELVSNAIKRAYDFFISIGYLETYYLEIVFQKEVLVETANGDFTRVYGKLGKDNRIYLTDWNEHWLEEQNSFCLKMSKEFYESIIVHEVAHFIAEKIAGCKIEITHSEYIAYVVQLSQMQSKMREAIFSKCPLSAFETEEINLEVMLVDPSVFAVKSYNHHKGSKGQYLKEILNGAAQKLNSVDCWYFP